MPNVNVRIEHSLEVEKVKETLTSVLSNLISSFEGKDVNIDWQKDRVDFDFKSLGFSIQGDSVVDEDAVTTNVNLPFAAMMFKGRVEKAIKKHVGKALEESSNAKLPL